MTPTILHVLPHPGGGAETYIDNLGDAYIHERFYLSAARTPLAAAPSIASRWPLLVIAKRRADLVHAHGDVASLLSLPLRPQILVSHGLHLLRRSTGPRGKLVAGGLRRAITNASVMICETAAERDELLAIGAPAERLELVPNGFALPPTRTDRDAVRAELGLAEDDVAVLFVGQLEERKDPLTAIDAVALAGPPLVMLVAGEGPLADRVAARDGVRFLGFRRDVDRLLGAADIFVAPSRREGVSYALLEAMGHGLPIVAADGPGTPEAMGDAGIVVSPGDPHAFAAALGRLASDPAERARLGGAGRDLVQNKYSLERFQSRINKLYAEALS